MTKILTPFLYLYIFSVFISNLIKSKLVYFVINYYNKNKSFSQKLSEFKLYYKNKVLGKNPNIVTTKNSGSHIFRQRIKAKNKFTLKHFNQIIVINAEKCYADVEGAIDYYHFCDACLKQNTMPAVCPELRSITVGGAISGVGVESSSFKYGLVHETILEMDVLLSDGSIVTCTPDNEHRALFYGIPNSYGSLGYILRARVKLIKVKPFVALIYKKFVDCDAYFHELSQQVKNKSYDFIDGIAISKNNWIMVLAKFTDHADNISNYRSKDIFFKAIQEKNTDYLRIKDYLWRWDTDLFWTTQYNTIPAFINHRWFRRCFGATVLRSDRLIMLRSCLDKVSKINKKSDYFEHLVQDVGIPIMACTDFINWYDTHIKVYPLWICPVHNDDQRNFSLFPVSGVYCDIGFYSEIRSDKKDPWYYNKLIEAKLLEINGIKALYSDNQFTETQFWEMFDYDAYMMLKNKYDSNHVFQNLYQKSIQ